MTHLGSHARDGSAGEPAMDSPRQFTPRYTAYATAHGRMPAKQLEADRAEWPGGIMAGFTLWISARWDEWHAARGLKRYDHWLSQADHDSFDEMIGAVSAGERAHPGFAYRDANGQPLAGPCDTPGCRYMSLPGGGHHDGACS